MNKEKVCNCDTPYCAKCLSVNCQDKNCNIHTQEAKKKWRDNWELSNKEKFPHPENY